MKKSGPARPVLPVTQHIDWISLNENRGLGLRVMDVKCREIPAIFALFTWDYSSTGPLKRNNAFLRSSLFDFQQYLKLGLKIRLNSQQAVTDKMVAKFVSRRTRTHP